MYFPLKRPALKMLGIVDLPSQVMVQLIITPIAMLISSLKSFLEYIYPMRCDHQSLVTTQPYEWMNPYHPCPWVDATSSFVNTGYGVGQHVVDPSPLSRSFEPQLG